MTYPARYAHLTAQRAYARRVARGGLPALLAPYAQRRPVPVIPAQRRRVLVWCSCGQQWGHLLGLDGSCARVEVSA